MTTYFNLEFSFLGHASNFATVLFFFEYISPLPNVFFIIIIIIIIIQYLRWWWMNFMACISASKMVRAMLELAPATSTSLNKAHLLTCGVPSPQYFEAHPRETADHHRFIHCFITMVGKDCTTQLFFHLAYPFLQLTSSIAFLCKFCLDLSNTFHPMDQDSLYEALRFHLVFSDLICLFLCVTPFPAAR